MKIKILGTRSEIEESAPYHSKHSGVLLDGKILLDIGEKEFLKYKPKWIFITHLHPDHAFFVRKTSQKIDIPLFAPEKFENKVKINVLKEEIKLESYKIRPIPTYHSKLVISQGYLIEKGNCILLYTGDIIWINKEYQHLLKNLDLVITEGSFKREGGLVRKDKQGKIYGHTGIPNLIRFFKPYTNHILFLHFGAWFYKDIEKARKKFKQWEKEYNINLYVGYDRLEINLAEIKN